MTIYIIQILCVCGCLSASRPYIGGQTAGPIMTKFDTHNFCGYIWEWFLPKQIPRGVAVGILECQKIKSPGNIMNCREK